MSSAKLFDDFNGDDAHLVRSIVALIELDAKGVLVPHGIGGHARGLLSAAGVRLATNAAPARHETLAMARRVDDRRIAGRDAPEDWALVFEVLAALLREAAGRSAR